MNAMSHGLIFNRGAPSPLLAACAQIAFRPDRMPVTAEVRQLRSSCGEPIASSASRTVSMSPCWSRPYRAINRIASRAASSLDFAVAEATSAPLASHRVRSNESVARCAISRGFVYAGMSVRPLAQLIFDHSNSRPHYVAFGAAVRVMLVVVTAGGPDAIIIGESTDKLQEGVGFRRRKVKRDCNGARIRFNLGHGSTPWLRLGSSGCFWRRQMTLDPHEFIRRFLMHVLPQADQPAAVRIADDQRSSNGIARTEAVVRTPAGKQAIRRNFGRDAAIQRCQIHKARNIQERLPKSLHASVRRVLRQAWELDDADKAEKLLRNLARRLERDWAGVAASILEGIDEILTVTRLGLPDQLRRSLACSNMIENVMGTVRRVCRNVKRWNSPSMAMRWTAAAMQEASKGFRRLKAHKQLPLLRRALLERQAKLASSNRVAQTAEAA